MGEAQLAELVEAIKENGQRKAVVMLDGLVLDGRNRWIACEALGREQLTEPYLGPTDDKSLREFVADANERRMHHEAQFLANRRRERVAAARRGGKSITVIAKEEGVSTAQVQRDLQKTAHFDGGVKVEPEGGKVQGKDGRQQPSSRPKRDVKADIAAAEGTPTPVEESNFDGGVKVEPEAPTDTEGEPIPEQARPAFETAKTLTGICRDIDELLKRIEAAVKGPGGRLIRLDSVRQQMRDAKGNLWANRATHVCPYCKGVPGKKPCECCKDEGWVAKFQWEQAPGTNGKEKPK